jgi:hypothetical protein
MKITSYNGNWKKKHFKGYGFLNPVHRLLEKNVHNVFPTCKDFKVYGFAGILLPTTS